MDIAKITQTRYTTKAFTAGKRIPDAQIAQLRTLLRNAPASVNSQPWHFILAGSEAGKALVAKAMHGGFAYNEAKVLNASHVVVLCGKRTLDDAHLQAVIEQENRDGRFANPEAMATQDKSRRFYVNLHQNEMQDESVWIAKQVYLALGTLLLGAASLEIDACTMEGFDSALLDQELGLEARNLTSLVVVALGYRSEADFNAKLPKSRLPENVVISEL